MRRYYKCFDIKFSYFLYFSAVVTPKMFTQKVLLELRESGKVNGIVLLGFNDTDPDLGPPVRHSDDNVCPNNPSSLYAPSESGFCSSEKVCNTSNQFFF